MMKLSPAIPVLRIFSVELARTFYIDYLGFTVDWEHRFGDDFPLYMQIRRSGLVLHLTEHYGDATPGSTAFIPVEGIDALHAEISAKPNTYAKPQIVREGWGKVMQLTDPFANKLRFCEQTHE